MNYSYPLKSFHKKFESSLKKVQKKAKDFFWKNTFKNDKDRILAADNDSFTFRIR